MAVRRHHRKKKKRFMRYMQGKLMVVFMIVLLAAGGLIGRITYINRKDGERYEKRVLSQQSYTSSTVPYQRGSITDRNGTVLASSDLMYNLILDAKLILQKEESLAEQAEKDIADGKDEITNQYMIRDAVSAHFGIDRTEIDQALADRPESQYIVLRKHLEYDIVNSFETEVLDENSSIVGVWFEEEYVRNYPYGDLAAHVIGFTSSGNVGTGGIEQYYNDILNGTDGREYGYYDSELNLKRIVKPAVNGYTVVSTIDANIQHLVQKHLDSFYETTGAKNAGVLVMDPNNGDILAMGVNQSYDLNNPRDLTSIYTQEEIDAMDSDTLFEEWNKIWRNFCISTVYEPGSTWKPMTIAAALEEDLVTTTELFECDGYEYIGGYRISCNNRSGHGYLTLTQSLMKSCNDALMEIGQREGYTLFCAYQKLFGLGSKTGIDLPGEEKGLLKDPATMGVTDLATNSFGQNFNVTMVQMAAAFSSLVNGGYYYEPRVVKEILDDNGATIEKMDPVLVRETVSEATSEFIKEAMYMTVAEGTAQAAGVEGYLIGGKTGTAQKQPREDKHYVVSFLGCVPADDPQVVIYVVIDEAQNVETEASSTIATTFASQILEDILPFLSIYPDGDIEYNRGLVGNGLEFDSGDGEDAEDTPDTTEPLVGEDGEPIVYDPSLDESYPDAIPDGMDTDGT